jgi:hypothetical protein
MSTDPRAQLAELRRLSMSDLKQRWRDLIGTDPPQYSRSFLVSRLAYRIQELTHGGLSASALADMDATLDDAGCDKLGRIRRRRNGGPGCRKLLIGTRLVRGGKRGTGCSTPDSRPEHGMPQAMPDDDQTPSGVTRVE